MAWRVSECLFTRCGVWVSVYLQGVAVLKRGTRHRNRKRPQRGRGGLIVVPTEVLFLLGNPLDFCLVLWYNITKP